jgi:hypothetical protein
MEHPHLLLLLLLLLLRICISQRLVCGMTLPSVTVSAH